AGGAPGQGSRQGGPLRRQHLRRDAAGFLGLALDGLDDAAVTVAEVAVKELGEEVEITATLPVVKKDAFAAVEFEDGVLASLDRPGQEQMAAGRIETG